MRDDAPQLFSWWMVFWVLSIGLHLSLWWLRVPAPFQITSHDSLRPAEIYVEPEELSKSQKPIVQTSRANQELTKEEEEKAARFGGEERNRAKRETRSAQSGRFQQGPAPQPQGQTGDSSAEGNVREGIRQLMPFGSNPHALPNDIAEGNETLLNTDSVKYASFINRIADQVYDAWVRNAREAMQSVTARKKIEPDVYVTKLLVTLGKQGEVTGIKILKSSGLEPLDDAPKRAFWNTSPFLNPPAQMFGDQATLSFVYEFHFEWRSSSFNIVPFI